MISTICHKKWVRQGGILVFWLLLWQIVASMMDNAIVLVTPVEVVKKIAILLSTKDFYYVISSSCLRIFCGLLIAWVAGILLGILAYQFTLVQELLAPVIHLMKAVPVASFVILALIWVGSEKLTFLIVFLISMPVVYEGIRNGLATSKKELLEVSNVFRFSMGQRIWYIYRPACIPFLLNSATITIGLAWKSGIAAEVIGIPAHSIGERLYMAKISLETGDLFAWTFFIIVCSYLFEKALFYLLYWFAGHSYEEEQRKQ